MSAIHLRHCDVCGAPKCEDSSTICWPCHNWRTEMMELHIAKVKRRIAIEHLRNKGDQTGS
jgi:uncharacterized Zn finger protein (UPF0148 family)